MDEKQVDVLEAELIEIFLVLSQSSGLAQLIAPDLTGQKNLVIRDTARPDPLPNLALILVSPGCVDVTVPHRECRLDRRHATRAAQLKGAEAEHRHVVASA